MGGVGAQKTTYFYIPSDHIFFLARPGSITFNLGKTHLLVPAQHFVPADHLLIPAQHYVPADHFLINYVPRYARDIIELKKVSTSLHK